jgi:membrane protein implicated in regulation of membrane protease activity
MDPALIWLVAGFALVILELLTGTFYLLVIGAGAFAGALAAWLGGPFLAQAVASCAVALVGTFAVRRWHVAHQESGVVDNLLDRGLIAEGVRIVPQQSAWVVERLGKFHARSNPAST